MSINSNTATNNDVINEQELDCSEDVNANSKMININIISDNKIIEFTKYINQNNYCLRCVSRPEDV